METFNNHNPIFDTGEEMVLLVVAKEIDAAKIYIKQLQEELDYLIEMTKLGEPRKSGIYYKMEQLNLHIANIEKEAKEEPKQFTVNTGIAKIDIKTGIKKVVQP